jgi:hypothetical protein
MSSKEHAIGSRTCVVLLCISASALTGGGVGAGKHGTAGEHKLTAGAQPGVGAEQAGPGCCDEEANTT